MYTIISFGTFSIASKQIEMPAVYAKLSASWVESWKSLFFFWS